jgi:hypothetical protein
VSKCNSLFQDIQELRCRIAYGTYLSDPRIPLNELMSFEDFTQEFWEKYNDIPEPQEDL